MSAYFILGAISAYRAFYQVRSLAIVSSQSVLQNGTVIDTRVESYARGPVDLQLELVQGAHSILLAQRRVPNNDFAFWDPRIQSATITAIIAREKLAGFNFGPARLRATALGRPQWTRLPPPMIRELSIEIR